MEEITDSEGIIRTEKTLMVITRHISLKPQQLTPIRDILVIILEALKKLLKEQTPFKNIHYLFCGSYRDAIKISQADEFDVNLVIGIPKMNFEENDSVPGFVRVNVKNCVDCESEKFLRGMSHQGYLLVRPFQSWFEGFLCRSKIDQQLKGFRGISETKIVKSGPAHTLKIKLENSTLGNFTFSVDLVPALMCVTEKSSSDATSLDECIAIPKPVNGAGNNDLDLFVPSYPDSESAILKDRNNLKSPLRLFKKLRDTHNIGNLKSYYIKTVFMKMVKKKKNEFWNQPTEVILLKALNKMVKCLQKRKLCFYWGPNYNMLSKLSGCQIDTMRGQLASILKKFENGRNTIEIVNLFLGKDEVAQMLQNKA